MLIEELKLKALLKLINESSENDIDITRCKICNALINSYKIKPRYRCKGKWTNGTYYHSKCEKKDNKNKSIERMNKNI